MTYYNTPLAEDSAKSVTEVEEKMEVDDKEVDKTPKGKLKSPTPKEVTKEPTPKLGEAEKADDGESLEVYVDEPSLLELDAELTGPDNPPPEQEAEPEPEVPPKENDESKVEEEKKKEEEPTKEEEMAKKDVAKDNKSSTKDIEKTDVKEEEKKSDDKSSSSDKKPPSTSSSSTRRRFVSLHVLLSKLRKNVGCEIIKCKESDISSSFC